MDTDHHNQLYLWAHVGFQFSFLNSQVSPVWPPEGIALASLLLLGRVALPGVFFGAFLANFFNNPHVPIALLAGLGNTLGSFINYTLLVRLTNKNDPLYSSKGLLYFMTICTVPGSAVSALIGVSSLLYFQFLVPELYFSVLFTWFSGEMLGFLIVAPLLYVWLHPKEKLRLEFSKQAELAIWILLAYICSRISFSEDLPLLFLPIPFVILASLRFQQFGATLVTLVVTYTAVTLTIQGHGVFARKEAGNLSINDSLIFLDAYLFCIGGIAYFLVTATRERERAQHETLKSLQILNELKEKANEELEKKVLERTLVIEEQRIEIENQLDVAKRIQESLLPQNSILPDGLEIVFKYIPMMKVGGDLFDIHWKPESEELGVFICDVSGHGIPAAFLSALVKMSLENWKKNTNELTNNLEFIRKQIAPNLREHFVTASLAYKYKIRETNICKSRTLPLFIIRKTGDLISLKPMGRIITPVFNILSEEMTFQLERGDLIVMLTDGLTEARSPSSTKMFGEEELLKLVIQNRDIPLNEILDIVFDTVIQFSGGMDSIQDDLTLGIMRYTESKN